MKLVSWATHVGRLMGSKDLILSQKTDLTFDAEVSPDVQIRIHSCTTQKPLRILCLEPAVRSAHREVRPRSSSRRQLLRLCRQSKYAERHSGDQQPLRELQLPHVDIISFSMAEQRSLNRAIG